MLWASRGFRDTVRCQSVDAHNEMYNSDSGRSDSWIGAYTLKPYARLMWQRVTGVWIKHRGWHFPPTHAVLKGYRPPRGDREKAKKRNADK